MGWSLCTRRVSSAFEMDLRGYAHSHSKRPYVRGSLSNDTFLHLQMKENKNTDSHFAFCYLVIPADYSGQLTHLLRYPSHAPSIPSTSTSTSSSSALSTFLLLTQAQILQSAPTPASGATVAMQNRDALGIPMEIPEPEAPITRTSRRSTIRPGDRDRRAQSHSSPASTSGMAIGRRKSPQPNGYGSGNVGNQQMSPGLAYGIGIGNTLSSRLGSYADQYMATRKDQFGGLPELFSKGLSDINGVVSNTVSEIRVSALRFFLSPRHLICLSDLNLLHIA